MIILRNKGLFKAGKQHRPAPFKHHAKSQIFDDRYLDVQNIPVEHRPVVVRYDGVRTHGLARNEHDLRTYCGYGYPKAHPFQLSDTGRITCTRCMARMFKYGIIKLVDTTLLPPEKRKRRMGRT